MTKSRHKSDYTYYPLVDNQAWFISCKSQEALQHNVSYLSELICSRKILSCMDIIDSHGQ